MSRSIGSVTIPYITQKDVSLQTEIEVKEFFNSDTQFFEISDDLEANSYLVYVIDGDHPNNKSVEQQTSDLEGLIQNTPDQNAVTMPDNTTAYAAVNSVDVEYRESPKVREVSLDMVILPQT